MADRERRMTPPYGGVFVARTTVLDAAQVRRALTRISHEIIERNQGLEDVVLVALQTGGVEIAQLIARMMFEIDDVDVPIGTLDVALYRDDIGLRPVMPEAETDIQIDLGGKIVVLVDDVGCSVPQLGVPDQILLRFNAGRHRPVAGARAN